MHHNQTVKAKADEGNWKLQATYHMHGLLRKINVWYPIWKHAVQKGREIRYATAEKKKKLSMKNSTWQNYSLEIKGESKTFPNKQKLRVFPGRPALQQMLKEPFRLKWNTKGRSHNKTISLSRRYNKLNVCLVTELQKCKK